MNDQVNNCDQNKEGFTKWGEACNSTWKSKNC